MRTGIYYNNIYKIQPTPPATMLKFALDFTTDIFNVGHKNKFRTIYWHGERYYCAAEVDAHMKAPATESAVCNSNQKKEKPLVMDEYENIESGSVSATDYWNAIANDGTIALSSSSSPAHSPCKTVVTHSEPADSPRSVTSSASTGAGGGGASSRGRAIGKRNQEFYLPEGGVRLSHVSIGRNDTLNEWFGKYDKESNTIIRTSDAYTDTEIAIYETLAHFAQEHDRSMQHSDYKDYKDTPNVWKNHLFTFYNTVTCNWEPLSNLRE